MSRVSVAVALGCAIVVIGLFTAVALGADPSALPTTSASPANLLASGDLRSEGAGPGLVGNPLLIDRRGGGSRRRHGHRHVPHRASDDSRQERHGLTLVVPAGTAALPTRYGTPI